MKAIESYLRFTDWLNAKFAWIVAFLIYQGGRLLGLG